MRQPRTPAHHLSQPINYAKPVQAHLKDCLNQISTLSFDFHHRALGDRLYATGSINSMADQHPCINGTAVQHIICHSAICMDVALSSVIKLGHEMANTTIGRLDYGTDNSFSYLCAPTINDRRPNKWPRCSTTLDNRLRLRNSCCS